MFDEKVKAKEDLAAFKTELLTGNVFLWIAAGEGYYTLVSTAAPFALHITRDPCNEGLPRYDCVNFEDPTEEFGAVALTRPEMLKWAYGACKVLGTLYPGATFLAKDCDDFRDFPFVELVETHEAPMEVY